jgi:hypothetical protein
MNEQPDRFPILRAADTMVRPTPGFAWLVMIQRNSDGDAAITQFLADRLPKEGQKPGVAPVLPDFDSYPQFSAKGTGAICIADCAWLALVRQGIPEGQGPNPTEAAIMAFMQKHGRKTPRPK